MKILGPWRRPRHRTVLLGSNLSEAAIGVAIRSCPGVQPRRSYSRLHAIIADSASFANSADRFANNFASDKTCHFFLMRFKLLPRLRRALLRLLPLSHRPFEKLSHTRLLLLRCKDRTERWLFELPQ